MHGEKWVTSHRGADLRVKRVNFRFKINIQRRIVFFVRSQCVMMAEVGRGEI